MAEYNVQQEPEVELEWMLQSSQVDDGALVEVLGVRYSGELRSFILLAGGSQEKVDRFIRQVVEKAGASRHRFTGERRLLPWLLALTYQMIRPAQQKFLFRRNANPNRVGLLETDPFQKIGRSARDPEQQLVFFLRYYYKLSVAETAFVLQVSEGRANQWLEAAWEAVMQEQDLLTEFTDHRRDRWPQPTSLEALRADPGPPHTAARAQTRLDVWQAAPGMGGGASHEHLLECDACRDYASGLEQFETWLAQKTEAVGQAYINLSTSHPDAARKNHPIHPWENKRSLYQRRNLSFSLKEIIVSLAVISILFVLAWYGDVFYTEPVATQIILDIKPVQTTPTPYQHSSPPRQDSHLPAPAGRPTSQPRPAVSKEPTLAPVMPSAAPIPIEPKPGALPPPEFNQPDKGRPIVKLPTRVFLDSSWAVNRMDRDHLLAYNQTAADNLALVLWFWGEIYEPERLAENLQFDSETEDGTLEQIVRFVDENTPLNMLHGQGGSLKLVKTLIAGGYPVILVEGGEQDDERLSFETVYGYDDFRGQLMLLAPTLLSGKLTTRSYQDQEESWLGSDQAFLLVYADNQEGVVRSLVGNLVQTTTSKVVSPMEQSKGKSLNVIY